MSARCRRRRSAKNKPHSGACVLHNERVAMTMHNSRRRRRRLTQFVYFYIRTIAVESPPNVTRQNQRPESFNEKLRNVLHSRQETPGQHQHIHKPVIREAHNIMQIDPETPKLAGRNITFAHSFVRCDQVQTMDLLMSINLESEQLCLINRERLR